MPPSAPRKAPLNSICASPPLRRSASRWLAGMVVVVGACTAHGQDGSPRESSLRPSYHACISASQGVTVALNDCIGAELAFQDKLLNRAYRQLRTSLPEGSRHALRTEERAWITLRDKHCTPAPDGGTAALLDANQCQLDEIAARAVALEERIR